MKRLNVFRALNPGKKYPLSPFNVTAQQVKYDLPLPAFVADALAYELSPKGHFHRVEQFCTPLGIEKVRQKPRAFESASPQPTYAESVWQFNLSNFGPPMGYLSEQAACNSLASAEILRYAIEQERFTKDVCDFILNRHAFFFNCGGFEIGRLTYYFDQEEKKTVDAYVDMMPIPQEPQPNKMTMFRQMLNVLEPTPHLRS